MGFSQMWIAVRGTDAAHVHEAFEVRLTDEREEFPESSLVAASLDDGWYLVVANGWDSRMEDEQFLAALSADAELVASGAEEHVMATHASRWRDGVRVWHIEYLADGKVGVEALRTSGQLPPRYDVICAELAATRSAGDWTFEVPVELAREAVGYRYDESPSVPGQELPFVVLASTAPGVEGLFTRIKSYMRRRADAKRAKILAELDRDR